MEKLLIVENEKILREQLKWGLSKEYDVLEAHDRVTGMEMFLEHAPKVLLLDLGLPPDDGGVSEGFRCLDMMTERAPETKIVVLTGNQERDVALRAIACGAYDFYQKPVDLNELKIIVRRAFHLSAIEEQGRRLQAMIKRSSVDIEGIADHCAALQELLAPLQNVGKMHKTNRLAELHAPPAQVHPEAGLLGDHAGEIGMGAGHLTLKEVRDRVEKSMIHAAVETCRGNMAKASELLGVSRPALYDLMKKHGLFKPSPRP